MTNAQDVKVVLALIVHEGKFLLIKRRKVEGRLEWAFPGGKVLPDEDEDLAVVREASEEVGLNVSVKEKLFQRKHPDTGVTLVYYSCDLHPDTSPQDAKIGEPDEITNIQWVDAAEVQLRFTSDVHPLILDFIQTHTRAEEF